MVISSCTISGNTAGISSWHITPEGGGVFVSGGTVAISSSTISGNTARHCRVVRDCSVFDGGGVAVQGGSVTIDSCTISGNEASDGGGVHISGGTVTLSSCTIIGNTGHWSGGGVFVSSGTVTITSSSIYGNPAGGGGGGVRIDGGTVTFSSCTITGNRAGQVRAHARKIPWPRWDFHMFCTCVLAGRRCPRSEWHGDHLIVHHQWQQSWTGACKPCLQFPIAPMGNFLTRWPQLSLAHNDALFPETTV